MAYDSIDTDETDSNADKEITVNEINGADMFAGSNGELLSSDGSGNLQFTSPPSGGVSPISSSSDFTFSENGESAAPNQAETLLSFSPNDLIYVLQVSSRGSNIASDLRIIFQDNSSFTVDSPRTGFTISTLTNVDRVQIIGRDTIGRNAFMEVYAFFG